MRKPLHILTVAVLLLPWALAIVTTPVSAEKQVQDYGWTKTWGSVDYDEVTTPAIDSSGNIYISGNFNSTVDFDPGAGTDNHASNGSYDAYLTKYNADGSYAWTKTWGSTGYDYIYTPSIDSDNNIYVGGAFRSTVDFDPGPDIDSHTSNGSEDAFLVKYNADGSYGWAKTWGSTSADYVGAVSLDSSDHIYVVGGFNNTVDFDPGAGTDNKTSNGSRDAFLTKYNIDGSYAWTKTWGGAGTDKAEMSSIDSDNNIYVGAGFSSTVDFDPGAGTDNKTSNGSQDAYLTKYNADGSYAWTKTWGNASLDYAKSLAINSEDDVYLMGTFFDTVDFDPGLGIDSRTSAGAGEVYLSKYSSDGTYVWTKTMEGTGYEFASSVKVDSQDNIYLSGSFQSTVDFDPGIGTDFGTDSGGGDIFLTRLNPDGSYDHTHTFGDTGYDDNYLGGIAIDSNDNIYISGMFDLTVDFNPFAGTDNKTSNGTAGYVDAFLTKLTTTYSQHIDNLPAGLSVTTISGDSLDNEDVDDGIEQGQTQTVRLSTESGIPLADIATTFSSDLDWSSVTGNSNSSSNKSFVHNLTSAPGTANSYTLYVPYSLGDDTVAICPGATTLEQVTLTCDQMETYTEADDNVSIVTINDNQYWKIEGLSSTGGISTTQANLNGTADTTTQSGELADTGVNQGMYVVLAAAIILTSLIVIKRQHRLL